MASKFFTVLSVIVKHIKKINREHVKNEYDADDELLWNFVLVLIWDYVSSLVAAPPSGQEILILHITFYKVYNHKSGQYPMFLGRSLRLSAIFKICHKMQYALAAKMYNDIDENASNIKKDYILSSFISSLVD